MVLQSRILQVIYHRRAARTHTPRLSPAPPVFRHSVRRMWIRSLAPPSGGLVTYTQLTILVGSMKRMAGGMPIAHCSQTSQETGLTLSMQVAALSSGPIFRVAMKDSMLLS